MLEISSLISSKTEETPIPKTSIQTSSKTTEEVMYIEISLEMRGASITETRTVKRPEAGEIQALIKIQKKRAFLLKKQ